MLILVGLNLGSPPPTRGKRRATREEAITIRITPAYAGKTPNSCNGTNCT